MVSKRTSIFLVALTLSACSSSETADSNACTVGYYPAGVSSAPPMTYYYGLTTDATGTTLTATNQISGSIVASGCGPFGVWESGNGGEVATELEFRRSARTGIFAMADGIVTNVQTASSPLESGEVEGIWVRYGTAYTIKYVHVVNPTVSAGDIVTQGQRLGVSVDMGSGQFFSEAELRFRSGGVTYAKAWNSMLSNAATFNALFGAGNCSSAPYTDTDGTTATTASSWVNNNLPSGQWNVNGTDQQCAF